MPGEAPNPRLSTDRLPMTANLKLAPLGLCLLIALGSLSAPDVASASQAAGERSLTPAAAPLRWRAPSFPASSIVSQRYGELEISRLLQLQKRNAAPGLKATQIGLPRIAISESSQWRLPALRWRPVAGGSIAKLHIRSADAAAVRVGLQVASLDDRVELRFAGSDRPNEVVAKFNAAEAKRLPGDDGLFWTPNTDGDTQIIEVFRPKGVPAASARFEAPTLSHLVVDSRTSYKIIEKIGESGSCNVDTICRIAALGQDYVNAKNAVAHMRFVVGASTFICTGTLLADTVPVTQIPYFHGANHCFSSNTSVAPVATQMQTVANTLNTFWNYEATTCGGLTSATQTQISGGATYLYSNHLTDGMLIRLNNPAPSIAYFAGWNAGPLANGASVMAIHHPAGDAKMSSLGQSISFDANNTEVGWTSGTTEGGSSGSGLFTLSARGGYELRGGLYGGSASCANTGSIANTQNRDYYSRLQVDFASMKTYLEPQPSTMEGSLPLLRPR